MNERLEMSWQKFRTSCLTGEIEKQTEDLLKVCFLHGARTMLALLAEWSGNADNLTWSKIEEIQNANKPTA